MRKKSLLLFILSLALLLCACTKTVRIDEAVTVSNVNLSASGAARGFIQAIFTDDRELFYAAFPRSFVDRLGDEDPLAVYSDMVDPDYEFYGTEFTASNDYTEENGYNADLMRENISFFHNVEESLITDINIVKMRVYFTSGAEYVSTDVYVVVYKADNNWYAYELQNADAEFAA